MKRAFSMLKEKYSGLCACFAGNEEEGYSFYIGGRDADARIPGKALLEKFSGRGGGKADMFQGSVKASEREICEFFRQATGTVPD